MQASSEDSMEVQAPEGKPLSEDGGRDTPSPSSLDSVLHTPAKKQTRQWAAWTRQEEESFFNALRQVGKNFDKITCRVQSKNKDQVRHYYYRLVRRMNKLLGPGFCLDAKNSKDTIAAMLRWWSLLEKYSCTASKLHLKPRRFKTFIEALAHQLLKDRNKSRRRRPSSEESYQFVPSGTASMLSKGSRNDAHPVNLIFFEFPKNQKIGSAKSVSMKGNAISENKGGHLSAKPMKHTRKTGFVASAAYKKWEKAAVAGVSLVADAAEQLERAANYRHNSFCQETPGLAEEDITVVAGSSHVPNPEADRMLSERMGAISIQPSTKLKLQLFPIDEVTRKALEKEKHNPHLELTLSARKRIASILEHLNRKWGNSSVALGELMLFPFEIQLNDPVNCQRWSFGDKMTSAADVYTSVGKPAVFRLRYGWSKIKQSPSMPLDPGNCSGCKEASEGSTENILNDEKAHVQTEDSVPVSSENVCLESVQPTASSPSLQKEIGCGENPQDDQLEYTRPNNHAVLSAGEWADSLTNISIGDLLAEASNDPPDGMSAPSLQNIPFSCDSFDAAIAAHLSGNKVMDVTPGCIPHSSIWDSDETCDGFSFLRTPPDTREHPDNCPEVSGCLLKDTDLINSIGFCGHLENATESDPEDTGLCEREMEEKDIACDDHATENIIGLTDIYWPDSLGALDLDIPSSRCLAQDLIFGDSNGLTGLSHFISNSLDAFQSFSFCMEKKANSTGDVETATGSSFSVDQGRIA